MKFLYFLVLKAVWVGNASTLLFSLLSMCLILFSCSPFASLSSVPFSSSTQIFARKIPFTIHLSSYFHIIQYPLPTTFLSSFSVSLLFLPSLFQSLSVHNIPHPFPFKNLSKFPISTRHFLTSLELFRGSYRK